MSRRRTLSSIAEPLVAGLTFYLCLAYLLLPVGWHVYVERHPALSNLPFITATSDGHPGDPINIALGGSKTQLERLMKKAGWYPADPLSLRSDVEIAEATVLGRPYQDAPVSSLYLWGRKEDLAFEQPVGDNPRERHHIRFWKSDQLDKLGRPFWAGSVTFDKSVGLSHTTGQITHHIDGDIDAERDRLFNQLIATGMLIDTQYRNDFQKEKSGYNGGGDPWHSDGRLALGQISN
ncbi:MAG: LssY C-terminal domain-containing protein [Planctomycetota bacterium]